ncbi:MAG: GGDEF domain-containing protein, partial [Campylobacteraceae bacterium]|nr:GGDEF domain-containing protein [Campylobacteraceae bacterium]
KKIFFVMEGYQFSFMLAVMIFTHQPIQHIAEFISLSLPLLGYVFAVIILGRKNGLEAYQNALQNHMLMSLDSLSNLLNRRAWYEASRRRWDEDKGISFMMLDIDHFKKVNDTYGHECGDKVIAKISSILLEQTREYDIIGRLSGEEFGIVLPQTNLGEAQEVAERIRHAIENTTIDYNGIMVQVTVSIGLIQSSDMVSDFSSLVVLGDKCLYNAKEQGRNCVISYEEI